ncbi:cytochrome P450 [Coleofasciculus sp. F4-SAH-05]|uniref:cytochrome P450 n=2 Tax=unclassified Coleofasciculus TaxID=2692782 RepID=UPI004063B744
MTMALPNRPKQCWLLQVFKWLSDPVGYMEATAKEYGDIFTSPVVVNLGDVVFISNPQGLQTILSNPQQFPASGNLNKTLQPLLGSNSIILLDGEEHKKRRKLLLPPFHGERMQAYGQLICDITKNVTSQWRVDQPFAIRDSLQKIAMRVIFSTVFGLHDRPHYRQLQELLSARLNATSSPLSASLIFFPFLAKDYGDWSPGAKIQRHQRQIDELLYAEIRDRRAEGESNRTDILSLLLSARDENGEGMSDEELRDELITLLVGAYENTATGLAWAFYWVHRLPKVKEKLLAEIDSLGENPNPMSLFKLPYLTAVWQETLRIYPVGVLTLPRLVQESVEVGGTYLEAGTIIFPCVHLLHQREELYPEPKKFKPERFLERQFSPYEYIPFGAGARRCIGAALAEFEMKLVLATILKQYQLELVNTRPVKPQRRGLAIEPAGGVTMILKGDRISEEKSLVAV